MRARSTDAPIGVVAFSFGLRGAAGEPGPSNAALARWAADAAGADPGAVVVAQWEVARGLEDLGVRCEHVVEPRPGHYLDTAMVWDEASAVLRHAGVRRVVAVAQPFLHLRVVRAMVRRGGFTLQRTPRPHVPFDPSAANQQWWTRSRGRLVVYAAGKEVPPLRRVLAPLASWPRYG